MKVFASHNPNSTVRAESSSGGVFSIIAERVINEGGVVYGAAFDSDWHVVHRRVDSLEGLKPLRGSKYVYSHVGNAYSEAIADLEAGRKVLFSGTPCQIAAMRKREVDNPNLLLLEVVCHGAPEPEYWSRYLSEFCHKRGKSTADIASINFRDKRTGWKSYSFTIKFRDGKEFTQRHDDNLYMRAFLADFTLRKACFRCPFKYISGSNADITLGDLWGIEHITPELDNNRGTTLVIGRTNKGIDSLARIASDSELDFDTVSRYNSALVLPATAPVSYTRFVEEAAQTHNMAKLFRKYAGMPLLLKLKIKIYRLLHS